MAVAAASAADRRARAGREKGARDARAVGVAAQSGGAAAERADPSETGAQPFDADGSLPFTGAELALLAALGSIGVAAGLGLRRAARTRSTRVGA